MYCVVRRVTTSPPSIRRFSRDLGQCRLILYVTLVSAKNRINLDLIRPDFIRVSNVADSRQESKLYSTNLIARLAHHPLIGYCSLSPRRLMSTTQLDRFFAQARLEDKWQESLKAASTPEDVVNIALDHGYSVTTEDIVARVRSKFTGKLKGVAPSPIQKPPANGWWWWAYIMDYSYE